MIPRRQHIEALRAALERSRVVLLVGPRQCGKTTLARQIVPEDSIKYFDLEDPVDLARLEEPMTALEPLRGLVVIDEVQRRPDLFPVLRVLVDRRNAPARFLVLGSASGDLQRQSSESLAGRVEQLTLSGFNVRELDSNAESRLWLRGGFPLSYLARNNADSGTWRNNFIQTLLERDLPQWGVRVPAMALRRFWTMLAHYHGQTWNAAEPAGTVGEPVHDAPVSGSSDGCVHDPAVTALPCEHRQASGEVTESLCARQRFAAPVTRYRYREGTAEPPKGGRVMGRVRHRTGARARAIG
jgi:hypothetical protein